MLEYQQKHLPLLFWLDAATTYQFNMVPISRNMI